MNETERIAAWGNLADAAHWMEAGRKVQMRERGVVAVSLPWLQADDAGALLLHWEYRLAPEPEELWCNKTMDGERSHYLTAQGARSAAERSVCQCPRLVYEYVAKRFVESP